MTRGMFETQFRMERRHFLGLNVFHSENAAEATVRSFQGGCFANKIRIEFFDKSLDIHENLKWVERTARGLFAWFQAIFLNMLD